MGGSPRNTRMRARSSVPVAALQPASSSAAFASIQAIKDMQSATPNLEYPVELIMPRNKPGEVGPREPVVITLPVLCQLFHEPLSIASAKIGISSTALKRVCRKLGVRRWPFTPDRSGRKKATDGIEGESISEAEAGGNPFSPTTPDLAPTFFPSSYPPAFTQNPPPHDQQHQYLPVPPPDQALQDAMGGAMPMMYRGWNPSSMAYYPPQQPPGHHSMAPYRLSQHHEAPPHGYPQGGGGPAKGAEGDSAGGAKLDKPGGGWGAAVGQEGVREQRFKVAAQAQYEDMMRGMAR
eukprot:CAMPEP_0173419092 /NCGR_PEP_ID=MMETSP1357-20121228/1056_1 /TAXON_ID=77926 /ORGANISM="Hemiselmis rufescens, Strain PCC563" /LENGTH=292 /DNA_ID=CAMNT_0014381675 /DNA_START=68 /DNA_END=943 /DNA_ORIENTATION=+